MKNQADVQYNQIVKNVLDSGTWNTDQKIRAVWADGNPAYAKSVISQKMIFDNSEVPILTSKKVAWKTAIKELLWIWQMKSNRVQDLRDMGVNIWDEWELEDGTIGKSYGFQLGKKNRRLKFLELSGLNHKSASVITTEGEVIEIDNDTTIFQMVDQVDYLLYQLKNNPASQRHITTLWNPDDLDDMALTPCVYETQWYVKQGELHLEVRARSNDMALGNPFNVFQYNVLHRMIAQVTGLELGTYIFNIGDCHLYERHIDDISTQINRESYKPPTLWINPSVTSFYDFDIDDFELIDYKYGESISYEIAI